MKDVGKTKPLAAGAASLWSAVASQAHPNPAPEAPGKGGSTTTRAITTSTPPLRPI